MVIIVVSAKKFNWKRISVIIITVLFIFSTISLAVTKAVYDSIFTRYDTQANIPDALSATVNSRSIHQFPSGDNLLTGYHYPGKEPERTHGLIVLVPGFHAGGDDYLWQIESLLEYGWAVFTFDATGTRLSQGEDQIGFSQPVLDLEAALAYIRENKLSGYKELVLMGHSRGGYAVCCALAHQKDVAAVVSISGINSAMEGVMHMSTDAIGPVAYGNYGFLWLYQTLLFGEDILNRQAAQTISQSDVPVLVVHGTQDDQVPIDRCSVISHKAQITSEQVEYLLCPAGHTDLMYDTDGTANDQLMQHIHGFLMRCLDK